MTHKLISMALISLAAMAGVLLFSATVSADDGTYGVFYYNKDTGAYGYSYNYENKDDAETRAYEECSSFGGGCRHIVTFQGCGAFAEWRSEEDEYVFGYGYDYDTLKGALDRAMEECMERNDGYKCGVIMYACNE